MALRVTGGLFAITNSMAQGVWVASNSPTWSFSFENRRKGDKGFIFLNKYFPSRKRSSVIQISISHTTNGKVHGKLDSADPS